MTRRDDLWDEPPRVGGIRATWIAIILLILTVLALLWIVAARTPKAVNKTAQVQTTESVILDVSS